MLHTWQNTGEQVFEHFWRGAAVLAAADPAALKAADATLLLAPNFATFNAGGFEAFSAVLNEAISDLALGDSMQLLFFHPLFYTSEEELGFRDTEATEFARNSPHPTIGLLRTASVEQARSGAPTSGSVATCTLIELHERMSD